MNTLKTLSLAIALLFTLACPAQNPEKVWKEAEKAMQKDMTATALSRLKEVYTLSEKKGDTGQMLRAAIAYIAVSGQISGDSIPVALKRIDSIAWHTTKQPDRALWMLTAASVQRGSEEGNAAMLQYLREALADLSVFAGQRSAEYLPAVIQGKDSRIFGGDLLSLVSRTAISLLSRNRGSSDTASLSLMRDTERRTIAEYRRADNANAVIIMTLDSLSLEDDGAYSGTYSDTLRSDYRTAMGLIRAYSPCEATTAAYTYICRRMKEGDCDTEELRLSLAEEGVKHAVSKAVSAELRNIIAEMKQQKFTVEIPKKSVYPGQKMQLKINSDNMHSVKVLLYRLPFDAVTAVKKNGRNISRYISKAKPVLLFEKRYDSAKPCFHFHDSVTVSAPLKPGIYLPVTANTGKNIRLRDCIHVSGLRMIFFSLPGRRKRITVVDAVSGKPASGATVTEYDSRDSLRLLARYTTDQSGSVTVAGKTYTRLYAASYGGDAYSPLCDMYVSRSLSPLEEREETEYRLYTDRAVYRPSQTIHLAGIVFSCKGDDSRALYDREITLSLYDARSRKIATQKQKSDEYGAFKADFILPANVLPGNFHIEANDRGYVSVDVEEYKRPTFEVSLSKPEEKYSVGDTVKLRGKARTFFNTAVPDAIVTCEVKRRPVFYFRAYGADIVYRDTTVTDSEGYFTLSIPLAGEKSSSHFYSVEVSVTSSAAETQNADITVTAGRKPSFLSADLPAEADRDSIRKFTFTLTNVMGEKIVGHGTYRITRENTVMHSGEFTANAPVDASGLRSLPSGRYTLRATLADDSLTSLTMAFTLFSVNDRRPADTLNRLRLYSPSLYFRKDGKALIQLGTPKHDALLFYDITAAGKLIESRQISMSDSLICIPIEYRSDWGDGISVSLAMMKEGELHERSLKILKPIPDKKLRIRWTTFRDRLVAGTSETWQLHIQEPDGRPANASVLMSIYDASLDKFRPLHWDTGPGISRYVPQPAWYSWQQLAELNYSAPLTGTEVYTPEYDRLYTYDFPMKGVRNTVTLLREVSLDNIQPLMMRSASVKGKVALLAKSESAVSNDSAPQAATAQPEIKGLRTDFAETAYFAPALRTDANGQLTVKFRVPESLTRWNIKLFAHTQLMNFAESDTTATVSKNFSIIPSLPRFLRVGDRAQILSTVRNYTSRTLNGKARIIISDAASLREIWKGDCPFTAAPGKETTVSFSPALPFSADTPLLICRVTADAEGFSDGEQHYIPFLSSTVKLISSQPFSFSDKGIHTLTVPGDMKKAGENASGAALTVEYTSSPAWLAVEALPYIDTPKYEDALTLAAAYYASSLELFLGKKYPVIREAVRRAAKDKENDSLLTKAARQAEELRNISSSETPWIIEEKYRSLTNLGDAFEETAASARLRNLEARMTRLQRNDGGFSWWSGMSSSYYITVNLARLLLRCKAVTGSTEADYMIRRAVNFLDRYVSEVIRKDGQHRENSPLFLDYLDVIRLYGSKASSLAVTNRRHLIRELAEICPSLDMKEKAVSALVLYDAGYKKNGATALRSIMEHTVSDAERGRYFDSYRSPSFGRSYRIPTQVAAIEALRAINPGDTASLREMILWLLQAKRTQAWETPLVTTDAVYAILTSLPQSATVAPLAPDRAATLTIRTADGRILASRSAADGDNSGYIRERIDLSVNAPAPAEIAVSKGNGGLSWGSIYYTRYAPLSEAQAEGKSLRVERRYSLVSNGSEKEIREGAKIAGGSLVRVHFTVTADRDYDFVCLRDSRPACLEPAVQRSGYTYGAAGSYYLSIHDSSEEIFIESLSKGEHTYTIDFRVDRAGRYTAAPATVQCHYAPEYSGRTKAFTVTSSVGR